MRVGLFGLLRFQSSLKRLWDSVLHPRSMYATGVHLKVKTSWISWSSMEWSNLCPNMRIGEWPIFGPISLSPRLKFPKFWMPYCQVLLRCVAWLRTWRGCIVFFICMPLAHLGFEFSKAWFILVLLPYYIPQPSAVCNVQSYCVRQITGYMKQ